jgi:hypothetical protein
LYTSITEFPKAKFGTKICQSSTHIFCLPTITIHRVIPWPTYVTVVTEGGLRQGSPTLGMHSREGHRRGGAEMDVDPGGTGTATMVAWTGGQRRSSGRRRSSGWWRTGVRGPTVAWSWQSADYGGESSGGGGGRGGRLPTEENRPGTYDGVDEIVAGL